MEIRVLLLVILSCILFNGSFGLTFSTKLIHRFSDEAKELWISKNNGNVSVVVGSWPKKNSLEYFQLLLSNDLNKLLKPSQGSHTFFFGNEFYWLHYTWMDIGTPNVSFLVALDVGSDLSWVPCDCIQCAPLSASYYSHYLDRDLSEYNPSLSSTSKHLSCSYYLCKLSANCKNPDDPCPYIAEYLSENTSSSGFLVEDKLHLASFSEHTPQRSVQASIILGCGRKQSGGYLDGAAPDGLMGLGPGNISIPSLLAKEGLIRNSFSICFNENDSGRILFGDLGPASQQSTPFLPIGGKYDSYFVGVDYSCVGSSCVKPSRFQALVDSGTSFTFLPTEVYNKIALEFDKQINATRISSQGFDFKYCYNASSQALLNIPTVRFMFAMNQSFVIRDPTYIFHDNQRSTFCLTLMPSNEDYGIIGQNFMMGYHMVFNRENLTLGWSHSSCQDVSDSSRMHLTPPHNGGSPISLPTNEQQSTTNTQAVAPDVAGKASSKPSAASFLQIPSLLYITSSLLLLQCFIHRFD